MTSKEHDRFPMKPIGEIAQVVGGGTPKTSIDEYWGGGIPWLTPKDLRDHEARFVGHGERSLTPRGLAESSARLLPAGTVLVSSRAPIGYVAIAENPLATNQGFRSLILRDGFLSAYYYYVMRTKKPEMEAVAGGSTFKEISGKSMKTILVPAPPIGEQYRVAEILGSLDDRIEWLRRMVDLAHRLILTWFEGLPLRSYRSQPVGEVLDPRGGGTPRTSEPAFWDGPYPWATPRDLAESGSPVVLNTARTLTTAGLDSISSDLLPKDTVLMSSRAPIGYIAVCRTPLAVNQGFIALPPTGHISPAFVMAWLHHSMPEIRSRAGGSTFEEISKRRFRPMLFPIPEGDTYADFFAGSSLLLDLIESAERERESLRRIRDELIPHLVTGSRDVSGDVELRATAVDRPTSPVGAG